MGFRGLLVVMGLLVSLLVPATRADAALDLSPNPVFFSNGLISGKVELISVETGIPAGGTVLEGATGPTDDAFVFRVTMTSGAIRRFGVAGLDEFDLGVDSTGAGVIPGAGVDVSMFGAISGATQRVFLFNGGGDLTAGQSSDDFFVSFAAGDIVEGSAMKFTITPAVGLGSTFSIDVAVVPAPGTLAAAALVAIGVRRRRRRR